MARVLVALLLTLSACAAEEPLPRLSAVPEFTFRDQHNRTVGARDLRGSPWVADFIFTRCSAACPMLTSQMSNLKRRLGSDAERVPMVSFTVDPEHDTPEVLAAYAEAHGVSGRWIFLTGDLGAMRRTVEQGFRVHMGERVPGTGDAFDILHAQHFLLVDAEGRIRGYYPSDGDGLGRLEHDVRRLLAGD
jgi:protein SCO1